MTLEECFRICRTAVNDAEVEEALGVLRNFINLAIEHSVEFSNFRTLGTLVRQLAIHKDDMDSRILPAGLQWTAEYCEKIEGWVEANSAVEKHKVGEGPHELIEIPGPLPSDIIIGEPLPLTHIDTSSCTPLSDWVLPHKGILVHFMRFAIQGMNKKLGVYATEALEAVVGESEAHPKGATASVQANEFKGDWSVLNATDHLLKELFKD